MPLPSRPPKRKADGVAGGSPPATAASKKAAAAVDAAAAAAPVTPTPALVDAEASFPRGGSTTDAALVRRGGKAAKPPRHEPDEDALLFSAAAAASRGLPRAGPSFVEILRPSTLTPGSKLWGRVTAVTPGKVEVALPVGLKGVARGPNACVYAAKASPPLTDLYSPGQYVRCAVAEAAGGEEATGARRIELTMAPTAVHASTPLAALAPGAPLAAWVRSEEDHGWVMDVGLGRAVTAFLPRADAPVDPATNRPARLTRGAQVECVVASAPAWGDGGAGCPLDDPAAAAAAAAARGVVRLSAAPPPGTPGPPSKEPPGACLAGFVPGSLITATVDRTTPDGGALLRFWGGSFSGTADAFHVPHPPSLKPGARVRARILHVDGGDAKAVRLSLLPHLLARGPPPPALPAPGSLVRGGLTVARVDEGLGVLVDMGEAPSSSSRLFGYAHISNAADGRTAKLGKAFKAGGPIPAARVLSHRPMDGLATLSMKPSDVDRAVSSVADLVVGSTVSGTVSASDAGRGLLVALAPGVTGRVPLEHLAPPGRSAAGAASRHPVGSELTDAVVWGVDASAGRATLTLRKALAHPKLSPLVGVGAALPGARTHGVVTGVSASGVFVSLYGGLTGLAGASDLGLPPGEAPSSAFERGQIVKARVLSADAARGRVRLSLAPGGGAGASDAAAVADAVAAAAADDDEAAFGGWDAGDVVESATISAVERDDGGGAADAAEDGGRPPAARFILSLPPKAGGRASAPVTATLDAPHLADHPAGVAALASALDTGAALGPLLVLHRDAKGRCLAVTRKRSMVSAERGSLPSSVSDTPPGLVAPGYVASATPDALFVRFLGQCTGRVGLAHAADALVPDARDALGGGASVIGASVTAAVVSRDEARGRFSLSLRTADVGRGRAAAAAGARLAGLFADLEAAAAAEAGPGAPGPPPSFPPPGAVVAAVPAGEREYGSLFDLEAAPDAVALAPGPRHNGGGGKPPPPSSPTLARVLDVAPVDGVVDVSLRPELGVKAGGGKKGAAAQATAALSAAGVAAAAAWAPGDAVTGATVELVRADYLVASLPPKPADAPARALAFLPRPPSSAAPAPGEAVNLTITQAASPASAGRLIGALVVEDAPDAAPARRKKGAAAGVAAPATPPPAPRLAPGTLVRATVAAVHALHVDLTLAPDSPAPGAKARLHVTEAETAGDGAASALLSSLPAGTAVAAVVLGPMATPAGRAHGVWEVTTRASVVKAAEKAGGVAPVDALAARGGAASATLGALRVGRAVTGFVQSVSADAAWVSLSPTLRARLYVLDDAASPEEAGSFASRRPVGSRVEGAVVVRVDGAKGDVDLSTRPPPAAAAAAAGKKRGREACADAPALTPGTPVLGLVRSLGGGGVRVQVGRKAYGRAALTDLRDGWCANALAGLAPGTAVMAVPLGPAPSSGGDVPLSLRPSDGGWAPGGEEEEGGGEAGAAAVAAAIAATSPSGPPASLPPSSLRLGSAVAGYVADISKSGAFVTLTRGLDARVRLSDLAAGFVPDPAAAFPAGTLVVGKISTASPDGKKVGMSLRDGGVSASGVTGTVADAPCIPALAPGDIVAGRVRRVEAFGVFVDLAGAAPGTRAGLAHKSELADAFVGEPASLFRVGQAVRARVLRVDVETGRISLTLRPSALSAGAEADGGGADGAEGDGAPSDIDDDASDGGEDANLRIQLSSEDEEQDEDVDADVDADESDGGGAQPPPSAVGGLDAGLAVGWGDDDDDGTAAAPPPSSSTAPTAAAPAPEEPPAKRTRRAAKAAAAAAAAATDAAEAEIAARGAPTTPAAFERALAASPSSSFLWIRYAAHMLGLGEPEAARRVLRRALEAIDLADTKARFNVFVASLNLEARAGEPAEGRGRAALEAFASARRHTDAKALHLALLTILESAGHADEAAEAAAALVKAERGSCKAWLAALGLALRRGDGPAARSLASRATASLPARKHVKFLAAAALAEFRAGDADRGRALYEGVLRSHPRRTDLWAAYADQEIRRGDAARVRSLFERAVRSEGLAPRQAKFLFRRHLEFEKAHGEPGRADAVRAAARAYVERMGGNGGSGV